MKQGPFFHCNTILEFAFIDDLFDLAEHFSNPFGDGMEFPIQVQGISLNLSREEDVSSSVDVLGVESEAQ